MIGLACDNCEKPKVCPDDCGRYQDLEAERNFYKSRAESFERQKEYWKQKDRDSGQELYKQDIKILELEREVKELRKTNEVLRGLVQHKDELLESLR